MSFLNVLRYLSALCLFIKEAIRAYTGKNSNDLSVIAELIDSGPTALELDWLNNVLIATDIVQHFPSMLSSYVRCAACSN